MEMVWSIFWVPVGREGRRSATAKLTVCVYAAVLVQCTHLLLAAKIQQNLNPRKKQKKMMMMMMNVARYLQSLFRYTTKIETVPGS